MNKSNVISKETKKPLDPHGGILIVNGTNINNSDNSSINNNGKGGAQTREFDSTQVLQNDYGYQSFYYILIE